MKWIVVFIFFFFLTNWIGGRILLSGLNQFYGLTQHSDILLIGHSHLMLAVNKEQLENGSEMKVSKYTREGVNVFDRYYMIKQFLDSKYSDSLKIVFYGVDQFTFVQSGLSENSHKLFYPFIGNPIIAQFIKANESNRIDFYKYKFFPLTRYSDVLINASLRGWRRDFANYKSGTMDVEAYRQHIANNDTQFDRDLQIDAELLARFEESINKITERGIKVILINTPIIDILNDSDPENYQAVMQIYTDFVAANELVEYWDLNPDFSNNYSLFYDPIHLNPKGQEMVTEELIERLKRLTLQLSILSKRSTYDKYRNSSIQ